MRVARCPHAHLAAAFWRHGVLGACAGAACGNKQHKTPNLQHMDTFMALPLLLALLAAQLDAPRREEGA